MPLLPAKYDGNAALIALWLHDKAPSTRAAYVTEIERFLLVIGEKPLNRVTLGDLHAFADSLAEKAPATQERSLAAIKSLLTFGCQTMPAVFKVNAGAALKLPKHKERLAEKILSEQAILVMLAGEKNPRNHALLRLLYYSAIRRAELIGLCWGDLQERPERQAGQINVYGKGQKTRTILIDSETWQELQALRGDQEEEEPVFGLERSQVANIVRQAARRVGIEKPVSPHWMRHAHASHALNRGAPIQLVQATLGHSDLRTTSRYAHARPDDSSAHYLPS